MISPEMVKELRTLTGAGIVDCRNALKETQGDVARAAELLRAKGIATAQKKSAREARQGVVETYIHHDGRLGVLVELNSETDFVARTEEFRHLARNLAVQVAGMSPRYVSREEIPAEVVEEQRKMLALEADGNAAAAEKRLEKWFAEVCLIEQPYLRDETKIVRDVITEVIARTGENVVVRRFVRFKVGE